MMTNSETSDAEVIERIAQALEMLARSRRPAIPLSVDLWDSEMIATYLKRERETFVRHIACLPDFPKPIKLPPKNSHSLWKAAEVITWAEERRELVKIGRPRGKKSAS